MDVAALLARTPLFSGLPESDIAALAGLAEPLALHTGQCLYTAGSTPDYLYLLVSGRLRLHLPGGQVSYVGRLEPVGEIGVLTSEPHSTDVHALRDSLLLRFAREPLLQLLANHAPALLALTRLTLKRVKQFQAQRRLAVTGERGTVAVIPACPGVHRMALAEALLKNWGGWPHARLITSRHVDAALGEGAAQTPFTDPEASRRLTAWLLHLETCHRYVIYVADNGEDAWSLRCLRQADRVLMVAEADKPAQRIPVLSQLPEPKLLAPVELVLLRPVGDASPHTRAWCEAAGARAHYFVHPWAEADLQALASQVSGRGVGLVLGGGGARGFAHIGLIRALEQLHIPVHVMGGTSMGAFISALLACGYESLEIANIARETFVSNNYLNDYTLPRVSLIEGRRFMARLVEIFGDRRIEDMRRTYYCMSTNLTTGASVTHDYGPMATWVGSSMAVPGIAPPIAYRGELLCDGGVVDNLPTDVMQALERGSIIACSVSSKGDIRAPSPGELDLPDPYAMLSKANRQGRPGFREILLRTATLTADTVIQNEAMKRADAFIAMPVAGVSLFAWRYLDELIERGYEHAMEQLTPLRDQLVGQKSW